MHDIWKGRIRHRNVTGLGACWGNRSRAISGKRPFLARCVSGFAAHITRLEDTKSITSGHSRHPEHRHRLLDGDMGMVGRVGAMASRAGPDLDWASQHRDAFGGALCARPPCASATITGTPTRALCSAFLHINPQHPDYLFTACTLPAPVLLVHLFSAHYFQILLLLLSTDDIYYPFKFFKNLTRTTLHTGWDGRRKCTQRKLTIAKNLRK